MYQINTTTKKITNPSALVLGKLPAQLKIDFELFDGEGEKALTEGHQFVLTIGSVSNVLYATDENFVSFRYVPFTAETVSATSTIEITMDGVSVLDDTIQLTYVTEGQVQTDWNQSDTTKVDFIKNKPSIPSIQGLATESYVNSAVATKITNPAGGTAGQVLTKTASGEAWDDVAAGYDDRDYLCFTSGQANSTARLDKVGSPSAIELEYSTDKSTWTAYTWSGNTGATITLANAGDRVWFRGNNSVFSSSTLNYYKFVMTGIIKASGNIMSLVDKTCQSTTIPCNACFERLFNDCTSLITAPDFPATTITSQCYECCFKGCTNLVTAMELPATTPQNYCYSCMFEGCTSLKKFGDIPLSTFPFLSYCCQAMFEGCTSLAEVGTIYTNYAGTSASNFMFYDCTSLRKITFANAINRNDFNGFSNINPNCKIHIANYQVPFGYGYTVSDASCVLKMETSTASSVELIPSGLSARKITVSSSLSLSASYLYEVAYAEVILDVASGATVTAGSYMTFVDTPEAGKRNICVVRWSEGTAKLYVTIKEDLPQA